MKMLKRLWKLGKNGAIDINRMDKVGATCPWFLQSLSPASS